ncbi:MAG TPA: DUF58 domain-containing protein [Pyrinomonadaceae bacterium]|jgi:uncharacterized protein (DUF58 family)|nr:DUF58 domain-containing protein [Pyrinomonadaceae bacterium]
MRFVFSRLFFILLAAGFVPLSLSWNFPVLRWFVLGYDVLLMGLAITDWAISRKIPAGLTIKRAIEKRFAFGDANEVVLDIENGAGRDLNLIVKDEYPPEMKLEGVREARFKVERQTAARFSYELTPPNRGKYVFGKTVVRFLSRLGLIWCQGEFDNVQTVKVYPNMRRAKEMELKALGANSMVAAQRKAIRRGEGREFESMRDYVRGDELRHISWPTTARRGRLTTRQYQIERDQTIIIAIDSGRLMTGRIEQESKLDSAIQAALALLSAAARGGDQVGVMTFVRRIRRYLAPKRGVEHIDAVLEALHDLQPELIQPSYTRAFQHIAANIKKRALVVILTDLVDKDSSRELLEALKLLRPRHLPLVVTIGDRDLNTAVSRVPDSLDEVFVQSAAEEIIYQREAALRLVETRGGLALDVTAATLAPRLLQTYLRVKERGLL